MAVSRRQKENDTFSDIAQTLPIEESAKELDKASVLRIAIHYLKLRDVLADCETTEDEGDLKTQSLHTTVPNFSKDVLQALDGFLLMISKDGRILYATESISQYLGLRQVDVIGVHVQDIIHPQDYSDVATIFQSQGRDLSPEMEALGKDPMRRNFVVRMRCAFTPSVRSILRCSNFKPIYCSAFLKFSNKKVKDGEFLGMVALCKLASVMKVREMCVGAFFKTKHSLDLGYTAVDTRIRWILGFDPAEMVGLKAYEYFHPSDLLATSSCHTTLLAKGRSHSPCYRFMTKSGDWVWVRSKSCVTYDALTHLPNGLSLYTWIVRFDEEDERMKAIQAGEDPGSIGMKDTSDLLSELCTSGGSLNILELCNPMSTTSSQDSKNFQAKTTMPYSSTDMISPKHVGHPPPNINPFQSSMQRYQTTPTANISSPPYDHNPLPSTTDPFMGVAMTQMTVMSTPVSSPNCFQLSSCRQSSLDSHRETSPPYSSECGYSYSTQTSPSNSLNRGSASPTELTYYQPYNSPPFLNSPNDSSSPYSEYQPQHIPSPGNYSHQAHMPSFAIDTTAFMSPQEHIPHGQPMQLPMATGNMHPEVPFKVQFIKPEPTTFPVGGSFYDPNMACGYTQYSGSSHIEQVKAQYTKVGVAGGHNRRTARQDDAAAIHGISQWLQHSVH